MGWSHRYLQTLYVHKRYMLQVKTNLIRKSSQPVNITLDRVSDHRLSEQWLQAKITFIVNPPKREFLREVLVANERVCMW